MAIKKAFTKTKPVCKVTFSIEAKQAKTVLVVGDLNEWNAKAGALAKQKSAIFKGVFELLKDGSFEFKYLVNGEYISEPEADESRWNDFAGAENSLLNT